MITIENCLEKLAEFSKLENGWCFGNGVKPSLETINLSKQIINIPEFFNYIELIGPLEEGGIIIEYEVGDIYICLEIISHNNFTMYGFDFNNPNIEFQFKKNSLEKIQEEIKLSILDSRNFFEERVIE